MKFSRIFKETKLLWPTSIDISDGNLFGNGGYFFQLSKTWDQAELRAESFSEFHQTMVWAIFCGLHKLAMAALPAGRHEIRLQDVELDYVQHQFAESLKHYPRSLKRAYVNDRILKPKSKASKNKRHF